MSGAAADLAAELARYSIEHALDPRPLLVLVTTMVVAPSTEPDSSGELQDPVPTYYYPH